jgi:hypothetical protein
MRFVHWSGGEWRWARRALQAACLSVGAASSAYAQRPATPFDRGAWRDDYAFLKKVLEQRYSNLAWFAAPEGGVDLPALDRRTTAALAAAKSDEEARLAIQNFVSAFHDGHFSELPAAAPPSRDSVARPADPTYDRADPATGCAALGFAPDGLPQFSKAFEQLPRFRLLADGIDTPFRAGEVRASGDPHPIGILRIPSFEATTDQGLCRAAWARDEFWGPTGRLRRGVLRQYVERQWYATMAALLGRFRADSAVAVIIDIGNNSGGDDSGDIAPSLFSAQPLRSSTLLISWDSAAATPYLQAKVEALGAAAKADSSSPLVRDQLALFQSRRQQVQKPSCDLSWVWRERRGWKTNDCKRLIDAGSSGGPLALLDPKAVSSVAIAKELHLPSAVAEFWGSWTGPLYVLTDRRTYSSAEMFAAVLQNNRAATLVGGRSGGDGCGFMDSEGLTRLPHSGMRFRVPNCVRLRADGTDEVAGIEPDLPVHAVEGEEGAAIAMRVLNAVREHLTKSANPPRR